MRWRGKTVPLPPHFCTNPMDVLNLPEATMQTFTFHGWLVVEIFTKDGLVGIGNAALAPQVTKQVIDLHLKPLLIGKDPWDIEFLWQGGENTDGQTAEIPFLDPKKAVPAA